MNEYFAVEEAHEGLSGFYVDSNGQQMTVPPLRYRHAIYSHSRRLVFRTQTQSEAEELLGNLNRQQEEQL